MTSYCRLCLEASDKFEPIDDANAVTNRQKIGMFLPEVAIDSVDRCVVCSSCTSTLQLMYEFKLKCMQTEVAIEKYVKTNNVAGPVDLTSILDCLNDKTRKDIEFVQCDDYTKTAAEEELIVLVDTNTEINVDEIKKESYDLHSAVEIKLESCDENKSTEAYNYKCHVCNEIFPKFWMLKKHMKTHTACLKCNECGKIFNSEFNHRKHLLSHKTDCTICGKVFSRRCHLQVHLADIHGCMDETGRHRCPQCEAAFYTITALCKHEISVHSVKREDKVEYDEVPEEVVNDVCDVDRLTVKCEDCNKVFNSRYYLNRHRMTHKRDCEVCRKRFSSHSHLRAHLGDVHGCTDKRGRHKCEHCNATYYTEGALFKHVTVHAIEKGYCCTVCNKECTTQYKLKRHLRYHAECNKYECEYCQAKFALKSVLVTHIRRHTGEKPYKCEKCGRAFSQRGSLSTHLRDIHNGEKRFSCHLCQMQFKYRATLLLHIQKHNGTVEKSHVCDVCGKAFRLAFALRGHMLRHKNVKSYTCVICGMGFVDSCGLKRHMKTHTGEKPHQCHLCSFRCSQKSNLRIHIKSHLRRKEKR